MSELNLLAYFFERLEAIQMDERFDHDGRAQRLRALDELYYAKLAELRAA